MLPGACANWRVPTCAFSSTTTPSASSPTTDSARSCASMHAVQKDANACSNFLSTAGLTDRSSAAGAPANGTTATTAGAAAGTWKNTSGGRDERATGFSVLRSRFSVLRKDRAESSGLPKILGHAPFLGSVAGSGAGDYRPRYSVFIHILILTD